MAPVTPRSRPVEIRALAGARAIPPLLLVLFHYCAGRTYSGAKWFDLPVGKGYLWVEFFFILSGFVLTYVYGARWREFWQLRPLRPLSADAAHAALSAASCDAVRDPVHGDRDARAGRALRLRLDLRRALSPHQHLADIHREPLPRAGVEHVSVSVVERCVVVRQRRIPAVPFDAALFHDRTWRRRRRRSSHRLRRSRARLSERLRRPCRSRSHFEIRPRPDLPQRHFPRDLGLRHRRGPCRSVRGA